MTGHIESHRAHENEISTEVTILGGRYTIRSGYQRSFVEKTARMVNDRLQEIIREGGVISSDKVAILACMNIASELLKLREEHEHFNEKVKKRLSKMLSVLDTCLSQEDISYLTESNEKKDN